MAIEPEFEFECWYNEKVRSMEENGFSGRHNGIDTLLDCLVISAANFYQTSLRRQSKALTLSPASNVNLLVSRRLNICLKAGSRRTEVMD